MKSGSDGFLLRAIALGIIAAGFAHSPARGQKPIFACDNSRSVPATVVQSARHGTVRIIEWKTTEFGDKFSPQTRCNLVSAKFQKYALAGTLKYFTTGLVNRQPVICAVASKNAPCNQDSMLYTLKKGSNPRTILKQLLNDRSDASSSALNETGSRIYIDVEKIIEAKAETNLSSATQSDSNSESFAPLF